MGTTSIAIQSWMPKVHKWWARWQLSMKQRSGRRALEVRQTATIANKATVALLSIDGDRVLLAVTNGAVQFHTLRESMALPMRGTVR